jgi:hypothetical protein
VVAGALVGVVAAGPVVEVVVVPGIEVGAARRAPPRQAPNARMATTVSADVTAFGRVVPLLVAGWPTVSLASRLASEVLRSAAGGGDGAARRHWAQSLPCQPAIFLA